MNLTIARCSLSNKGTDSALGSNRADILRGDQNIDLFEKPLKRFLISSEKPFNLPIGAGDDFNLNDVVDNIHASVLSTPLIESRLGADSERAKNSEQLFTICLIFSASISLPSLHFNGR